MKNIHKIKDNIYITSDEDINDNDWIITEDGRLVQVSYLLSKDLEKASKVILTTDQDLINDGVQPINDEFLEWFAKNPSCEEVEVEKFHGVNTSIAEISYISGNDNYNWKGQSDLRDYKIIIPKEELKQEIIEQAAEDFYALQSKDYEDDCDNPIFDISRYLVSGFIDGVKWQQERMYSEEDLKEAFFNGIKVMGDIPNIELIFNEDYIKWFEQFKKK